MKKSLILSFNNIKKSLKQYLSFIIILIISAVMFSTAIILKLNVSKEFDKKYQEFNTASSYVTIPAPLYSGDLLTKINKIEDIEKAETKKGIYTKVTINFNGSNQEQNQIFYNMDEKAELNNIKIVEEITDNVQNPIYLPSYIYLNSDYHLKDKYYVEIDENKYEFTVKGYVEEMQYGNYSTSIIGLYLTNESYEYLAKDNKDLEVQTISVLSNNGEKSYNEIAKILSENNISIISKNYDTQVKSTRLIITNLLVIILLAFSVLILVISLLVSKFKIENEIEEQLTNMGVLKALGYTNRQIIFSVMFPYIIIGTIASLIGIGLSYLLIPVVSNIITMQSGFTWVQNFDSTSMIITLLSILVLIAIFTYMASKKIKKLNPINAIRGISQNEKKQKNHFEIEKTKGNIGFNLTLKNFANSAKQNILLGLVIFFLSLLASFSSMLFYNININPMNFVNTLVEEHPSVILYDASDIKDEILKMDEVKNAIYYDENQSATIENNSYKVFVSESFQNLANDLCYEGRNPKNENEIAIGNSVSEKYGLSVDDTVIVKREGKEASYKIVGLIQSVNNSGEVLELTVEGFRKLNKDYNSNSLYVYLKDENESQNFIEKVEKNYDISNIVNYVESMNSVLEMFVSIIKVVCIVIIIITILIIYLILYLIISSIITNRKQELGILKSIGYINRQLIFQISGGLMPSTIIAALCGMICSKLFLNKIFISLFRVVGAYKISFSYPINVIGAIAIILIIITFMISVFLSRKIKKIEVYKLIKE